MSKFVRRITLVDLSGESAPVVIFKSKQRSKRKISRWLKPYEKMDRRWAKAAKVYGAEVLRRHEKSSRKRRNGWLRDRGVNVLRAQRKAVKRLTK